MNEFGENQLFDLTRNISSYTANSNREFSWNALLELLSELKGSAWVYDWNGKDAEIITWSEGNQPDSSGVDAYVNTQITYDFFDLVLQNKSTDGNGDATIRLVSGVQFEDGTNWTGNAYSITGHVPGGQNETHMVFGVGKNGSFALSAYLDTVAHEYMHGVEHYHSGMVSQGESGAIMEALSDIYGELVEAWHNGKRTFNAEPDWIHNIGRNLANPTQSNNPDTYHGDNWETTEVTGEVGNDNGHVHKNSTVISHAAYLMWNGIDGDSNKKLTTEQLAKLWYRAMLMMPSDCDFAQCRTLVELAAESMDLTDKQERCVSEAFDAVGILGGEVADYTISPNTELCVYDANGELYGNYSYHVSGTMSHRASELGQRYEETQTVSTAEPHKLALKEGYYTIRLMDNIGAQQPYTFTVHVAMSGGKNQLDIYTDYGLKSDWSSLVTDAVAEDITYNNGMYSYHIPKINFESDAINQINEEIYSAYYPDIQSSVIAASQNELPMLDYVQYEWSVCGDVLSLYISSQYTWSEGGTHTIKNISISKQAAVTNNELLNAYGITQEVYHEKVQQALGSAYLDYAYEMREHIGEERFLGKYEETISATNIADTQPFINKDGHLCILGKVYSLAGPAYTESVINLETFNLSPYYGKDLQESSQSSDAIVNTGSQTLEQLKASLIGTWRIEGDLFHYDFNADGTCVWMTLQMTGTYYIQDDRTLIVEFPWDREMFLWSNETFDEFHSSYAHDGYRFWYFTEEGVLRLDGTDYYRDGIVDHKQIEGELLSKIEGSWILFNTFEYRFFADGTYEENTVVLDGKGRILVRTNNNTGTIEIDGENTAKLWADSSSDFGYIPHYTGLEYDPKTDTIYIDDSNEGYRRTPE